jgi:hypothetical protein
MHRYRPGDEDRLDPPRDAAVWMTLLGALARYHRYQVDGLEHVPRRGPALVVGFHSFPIAIGVGPLPLPVPLVQHVAPPILPGEPPDAADDEVAVRRLDERVRDTIAGLLRRR